MKKIHNISVLIFLLIFSYTSQSQEEIYSKLNEIAFIDQKVMMQMRDGVRLATDIYRPRTNNKVPIIFSRTPYNFNSWGDGDRKSVV